MQTIHQCLVFNVKKIVFNALMGATVKNVRQTSCCTMICAWINVQLRHSIMEQVNALNALTSALNVHLRLTALNVDKTM